MNNQYESSEPLASQATEQERPNDFYVRAETAEQQEIVQQARNWHPTPPLTCSEYDF